MTDTKGWSRLRRKRQACNARRNKPWTSSTGPRSAAGKAVSSMNALKHGRYARGWEELLLALRMNRAFIRHVAAYTLAAQHLNDLLAKRSEGKDNKINEECAS